MSTGTPWWAQRTTHPVLPTTAVRHHTPRTILTTALTTALIVTALALVLRGSTSPATSPAEGGGVAHRQTRMALIGACGPIYTFTAQPGEAGPVPATRADGRPNTQAYRTIVPMFGHYYPQTQTAPPTRFYDRTAKDIPTVETLLGWQAQGVMTAYYTTDAHPDDVTALKHLTNDPTLNMVAVPWESTRRPALPAHRKIAYATWGASQTCQRLAAPALAEFRAAHTPALARREAAAASTP